MYKKRVMKCCVTGGVGFIGSHLCHRLLSAGHQVKCIDNLNDYYAVKIKLENRDKLIGLGGFEFKEGDILNADFLGSEISEGEYDVVIHLAAQPGVRASFQDPEKYVNNNILGTRNILECCKEAGIGKVVFASSSSVYGNSRDIPFSEKSELKPISPYGISKVAGEMLCYMYSELFSISVVVLRFFTVYGPRQRPDMGIYKFTQRILNGEAIDLYGSGGTSRDYTYITDIVDGIMGSLLIDSSFEIINLGNARPIRLSYLISLIEDSLGRRAIVRERPESMGDPRKTHADISKAKRLLGYSPKVSIEEGVRLFVEWFMEEKQQKGIIG